MKTENMSNNMTIPNAASPFSTLETEEAAYARTYTLYCVTELPALLEAQDIYFRLQAQSVAQINESDDTGLQFWLLVPKDEAKKTAKLLSKEGLELEETDDSDPVWRTFCVCNVPVAGAVERAIKFAGKVSR